MIAFVDREGEESDSPTAKETARKSGRAECPLEAGEIVERPTEADEQPRRD